MRINEAYEHEAILPRQSEESCLGGCNKLITQCVDISAPVTLVPAASLGTVTVSCQGNPVVNCMPDPCGTSSTITVTGAEMSTHCVISLLHNNCSNCGRYIV